MASASCFTRLVKARQLSRAISDATEAHMEGTKPVDDGDEGEARRRQDRRGLVWQLLIDWSPILAGVADLVVQHFS